MVADHGGATRTGTRCPSRRTYSFSYGRKAPVLLSWARTVGLQPLRGRDHLTGDAASLHVVPGVPDDVEEGVVGVVHVVLAVDHHADHVGLAQPAHQLGALTQCRRGPALPGQVPEHGVRPLWPSVRVRESGTAVTGSQRRSRSGRAGLPSPRR